MPGESPRDDPDPETPRKVVKIKDDPDSATVPKNAQEEDVTPLEDPNGEMNATAA